MVAHAEEHACAMALSLAADIGKLNEDLRQKNLCEGKRLRRSANMHSLCHITSSTYSPISKLSDSIN